MTIGCNIWMICLKLNWYFYGLSRMFQLPQFVWVLRSSVWDFFINFLLKDATDRSKNSSDEKRFFIALTLYPLSFFAKTPFNLKLFNRRPTFCMCTWVLVSTGISLSFCSCSIYIIYYISAVIGGCLDLSLMYIHHKK